MKATENQPLISVVIPMRNERRNIATCIEALAASDLPRSQYEIIVVDGESDDGSAEIARTLLERLGNGRLITNPRRATPVGLNMGVEAARGQVVVILGAHSAVEPDFLSQSLKVLNETGADCVGGTLMPGQSDSLLADLINVAQNCPFGSGGAGFRYSKRPGYMHTVPFGAYRREVFEKIGGFDERLYKGQDAEFNFRMVENGLSIYYSPRIRTRYFSRSSFRRLFRQFFDMGWSKVLIFARHPRLLKPYYILPVAFAIAVWVCAARFFFASAAERMVYLLAAGCYVGCSVTFGFLCGRLKGVRVSSKPLAALLFPIVFFVMHFAYGLGALWGIALSAVGVRGFGRSKWG